MRTQRGDVPPFLKTQPEVSEVFYLFISSLLSSPVNFGDMTTRSEREKAQKLNEQHQAILSKLLREDDNKYCADCEAKGEPSRAGSGRERPCRGHMCAKMRELGG